MNFAPNEDRFRQDLAEVVKWHGIKAERVEMITEKFLPRVNPDVWAAACALLIRAKMSPSFGDVEAAVSRAQEEFDRRDMGARTVDDRVTFRCARCQNTGWKRVVVEWGGRELTAADHCTCGEGKRIRSQSDPSARRRSLPTAARILRDADFATNPCPCGGAHNLEDLARCHAAQAGKDFVEPPPAKARPPVSIEYVGAEAESAAPF